MRAKWGCAAIQRNGFRDVCLTQGINFITLSYFKQGIFSWQKSGMVLG